MYRLIFWPVLAPSFLLGVASGAMVPVLVLGALALGASPRWRPGSLRCRLPGRSPRRPD